MNAHYHQAKFLISSPSIETAPSDDGIEVAFAGRSNAGKSSAINTLTHQKSLAKTSKTPGRTQLLNFFHLDDQRRLVDLPGYGYAKAPEKIKRQWRIHLEQYFAQRQSLKGVIIIMDIRRPFTETDIIMMDWAHQNQTKGLILLTKSDKLKKGPAKTALLQAQQFLKKEQYPFQTQLFSALKKTGIESVHTILDEWFEY